MMDKVLVSAGWQTQVQRYQYALLALVVLVGAGLRLYQLGTWSFWIDEIFTVNAVPNIEYWPLTRLPIYLVSIRGVTDVLGMSEWSARLAPAIVGIITPLLLYFPIRRMFGPITALIAVTLLVLSPWHLYWSQNARFYAFWLLFYSLGLLYFYIGWTERRPIFLLLALVLLVLAVRERVTALFFVPVIVLYLFSLVTVGSSRLRDLKLRYILPLFAIVVLILGYDLGGYVLAGRNSTILSILRTFTGYQNTSPLRLSLAIVYRLSIPLVFFGLVGAMLLFRERQNRGLFVVINALAPPLLLVIMSLFVFTVDRYVFLVLPFWAILGAIAVQRLIEHSRQPLLASSVLVFLILFMLSEAVLYFQYQHGGRPNWREAMTVVAQQRSETDLILSTWPEVSTYYLGDDTGVADLQVPPPDHAGTIWFVIDESTEAFDPGRDGWLRENTILVDIVRNSMPGKSLDLRIYRLDATR